MKKTIITALVALLFVLAFVTCDGLITEPGAGKPGYTYTEDGQEMVTVSINPGSVAGGSRVLDQTIAQAQADWYEVIFKDNKDKFHKTDGRYPNPLTLTVPRDTYNDTNAVMLIGKKKTVDIGGGNTEEYFTLLATGYIKVPVNLALAPPDITFTVNALTADLSTEGDSFKIITDDTDFPFPSDFENETGLYYPYNFPCFLVPTDTRIVASLTIGGFKNTGNLIKNYRAPGKTVNDFVKFNMPDPSTTLVRLTSDGRPSIAIDTINELVLGFGFSIPQGEETYCVITFEIPVIGLSAEPFTTSNGKDSITWNIHGGANQGYPDLMKTEDNGITWEWAIKGEGVALEVADSADGIPMGISTKPGPDWE
jgi:hypothetical protein